MGTLLTCWCWSWRCPPTDNSVHWSWFPVPWIPIYISELPVPNWSQSDSWRFCTSWSRVAFTFRQGNCPAISIYPQPQNLIGCPLRPQRGRIGVAVGGTPPSIYGFSPSTRSEGTYLETNRGKWRRRYLLCTFHRYCPSLIYRCRGLVDTPYSSIPPGSSADFWCLVTCPTGSFPLAQNNLGIWGGCCTCTRGWKNFRPGV